MRISSNEWEQHSIKQIFLFKWKIEFIYLSIFQPLVHPTALFIIILYAKIEIRLWLEECWTREELKVDILVNTWQKL